MLHASILSEKLNNGVAMTAFPDLWGHLSLQYGMLCTMLKVEVVDSAAPLCIDWPTEFYPWHSLWELMSPFGMRCALSFCTGSICETKCIAFRFLVENSTWLGYMPEVHSSGKNANSPWEAEIELQRHKRLWRYLQTFGIICSLVQVSAQMISWNTGACFQRTHHEASRFQYHVQISQPVYT